MMLMLLANDILLSDLFLHRLDSRRLHVRFEVVSVFSFVIIHSSCAIYRGWYHSVAPVAPISAI
jgi:hypothetical protein